MIGTVIDVVADDVEGGININPSAVIFADFITQWIIVKQIMTPLMAFTPVIFVVAAVPIVTVVKDLLYC